MHDVLTSHPTYEAFERRLADAEVTAEAAAEHDRTVAAAYRDALANLKAGDPYPVAPEATTTGGWIYGQRANIRGERESWLAEDYDDIEARFHKAEDELIAKAVQVIAALDELTTELDELSTTANFVTTSTQRPAMIWHGAGNDTLENLITAVRSGNHLFRAPYAVGGPRPTSYTAHVAS